MDRMIYLNNDRQGTRWMFLTALGVFLGAVIAVAIGAEGVEGVRRGEIGRESAI